MIRAAYAVPMPGSAASWSAVAVLRSSSWAPAAGVAGVARVAGVAAVAGAVLAAGAALVAGVARVAGVACAWTGCAANAARRPAAVIRRVSDISSRLLSEVGQYWSARQRSVAFEALTPHPIALLP